MRVHTVFLACLVAAAAVVVAGQQPASLLLTTYAPVSGNILSSAWSFAPNNATGGDAPATLVRDGLRPAFPAPTGMGSLRRDTSLYIPSDESIYTFHPSAPQQGERVVLSEKTRAKAAVAKRRRGAAAGAAATTPLTQFWQYSLFSNSSTYIMPVPSYSLTCSAYDIELDMMFGLSAVRTPSGDWNLTLVYVEYNGDFYSYFVPFWTQIFPSASGSTEDPCRPQCAHDPDRSLFTFHWPAAAGAASNTGGQLVTIKISDVNYTPTGSVVSTVAWPPANGATTQPRVLGLSYSPKAPGQLQYAALRSVSKASDFGAYFGSIEPLSGNDVTSPVAAGEVATFNNPRILSTDVWPTVLVVAEYVAPYRYALWSTGTGGVVDGNIVFEKPQQQQIVGVHNWQ